MAHPAHGPRSLADQAVIRVLDNDLDNAVDLLERASRQAFNDASILNDLSAAYLARAGHQQRPLDLVRGLAAADRALLSQPGFISAEFNRALALEKLFLIPAAQEAWKRYRKLEPESEWKREASIHLVTLFRPANSIWDAERLTAAVTAGDHTTTKKIVSRHRLPARRFAEDLIASWGELLLTGNTELATRQLIIARAVGEELFASSGDSLILDTVRAAERTAHIELLAKAHRDYKEGMDLYRQGDYEGAATLWSAARAAFVEAGSPYELRAALQWGCAQTYLSAFEPALLVFADIAEKARRQGYRTLLAESLWMQGVAGFSRGDLRDAPHSYRSASDLFRRLGEMESRAAVESLLAEALDYIGLPESAWHHRLEALHLKQKIEEPSRRYIIDATAGIASLKIGEPRVALYFQEETVLEARCMRNPVALAAALFWHARYARQAGLISQAAADLAEARVHADEIKAVIARERALADILLGRAELELGRSNEVVIELLTKAIERSRRAQHVYNLIEALLARARAYRVEGNLRQAAADYERGIEVVEDWRIRIAEPQQRVSFIDSAQAIYDEMVLLQLEAGHPVAALEFVERARARTILEMFLQRSTQLDLPPDVVSPLRARDLFSGLPDNAVLVTYAIVGDYLATWVANRSGLQKVEIRVAAAQVNNLGIRFYHRIRHSGKGHSAGGLSGELYETLIRPIERYLVPGAEIIISAEGTLGLIPFAALRDPATGRYLVEEHSITVAPSGSLYVAGKERWKFLARHRGRLRALVVANSRATDRLPALYAARAEAEIVAREYAPGSLVLIDDLATKQAFLREAPRFDVVHFVGHAVSTPATPLWSYLAMMPSPPSQNAALYASEIYRTDFPSTALLVLSACETTKTGLFSGDGVQSLALAALAAGIPSVLGSLWNINDDAAADLMFGFHRRLAAGEAPAQALQHAQLDQLNSADSQRRSPSAWAAFQLIGGATGEQP